MSQKIRFNRAPSEGFYATLKQRVDAYFQLEGISPHANAAMWGKLVFFLGGYLLLYLLIMLGHFSLLQSWGLALALGIFAAGVGFNVSHDAIHGSLSGNKRLNELISHTFYMIGASPYIWNISHNVVHHTYTNIYGHDEDVEIAPGLIRLSALEELKPWQKHQHLYAFFLYGLTSLSWVLRKDYKKFFQKNIGNQQTPSHPRREYFNLFFYKSVYYFFFLVLPLLVLPFTWWQFLIGFVTMHVIEGLTIGLVFQLAHLVEETSFPLPDTDGNVQESWALHQMQTTANFSPNNLLVAFMCGGLNRQIEHHLFPRICHIHYPAVSRIVKQTAAEFGVPYLENYSFFQALRSHYSLLKRMGQEAEISPVAVPALAVVS